MFGLKNLAIDTLSFWLGFAAASLFWFVLFRLRKDWPAIRSTLQESNRRGRERRLAGVGQTLRQEVLQRAQSNHLAKDLFSLDEILVTPKLLAGPPYLNPEDQISYERYSTTTIGLQPENPEFASFYGATRMNLPEVLFGGARIAILGKAGAGKTVALASLASLIARGDPSVGVLANLFPIYIHVLDIDWPTEKQKSIGDTLSRAYGHYVTGIASTQLNRFMRNALQDKKAILILDGLDELPPRQLENYCTFLKDLIGAYPDMRMVVSGSTNNLERLISTGFEPLALSGWAPFEIRDFLHRWGALWNDTLSTSINRLTTLDQLDQAMLLGWLGYDSLFMTPLEWTLKAWGVMAGDLAGSASTDTIQAFLDRMTSQQIPNPALSTMAGEFIHKAAAQIPYSDLEKVLSDYKIDLSNPEVDTFDLNRPAKKTDTKNKSMTSGSKILNLLLKNNILTAWPNGQLSFTNPVWNGYLAALAPTEISEPLSDEVFWTAKYEFYAFCFGFHTPSWIEDYIQTDSAPLYRNLIHCAHWIRNAPTNHPNRTTVMRHVLYHLQNKRAPMGIRLNLLAACSTSNDPASVLLFRQLMSAQTPDVRYLGVLGCGINQDTRAIKEIGDLLSDADPLVRQSACFALASIDHPDARQTLNSVIDLGEETLRLVAAELLASDPNYGHEKLGKMLQSKDLLVRRAAVYGLSLINAPWVTALLEKVAVEDGQWVVRNAASQALENFTNPNPYVPKPTLHPADTPWLIAFAAKLGLAISKTDTPIPALMQALKSGTSEEQLAALPLIRNYPDDDVFLQLYDMAYSDNKYISQSALYTLWLMALSRGRLPNQIKLSV